MTLEDRSPPAPHPTIRLTPMQTTTFTYDALGRLTVTTYPDTRSVASNYGIWASDVSDEHVPPHVTGTQCDAYGRHVVKEQHLNGQALQTQSRMTRWGGSSV